MGVCLLSQNHQMHLQVLVASLASPGTRLRAGMRRGPGTVVKLTAAHQVSPLLLLLPERRVITISILETKAYVGRRVEF